MLPEDRRVGLHRDIGEVIDAGGGVLDVRLLTGLILARRSAKARPPGSAGVSRETVGPSW